MSEKTDLETLVTELERCAVIAEETGRKRHEDAPDPQEDSSEETGDDIAKAIRRRIQELGRGK